MVPGNTKIAHVQLPEEARGILPLEDPRKGITHNFNRSMLPSGQKQLALIAFGDREYSAIGILNKEIATSRFQVRVRCSFIEGFPPIPFDSIRDRLPVRVGPRAMEGMEREISGFTEAGGKAVLDAAVSIEPAVAKAVSRIMKHLRMKRSFKIHENSPWALVRQELDAVDTALVLAEMAPTGLDASLVDHDHPAPALTLLSPYGLEDGQIEVDANSFGGLTPLRVDIRGVKEFRDEYADSRVTVINVNRRPMELTLGVDLIIYYSRYSSYILVQYKRLTTKKVVITSRAIRSTISEGRYYPSRDKNFQLDLDRMTTVRKVIGHQAPMAPEDYRLNDDPFYFKFCRSEEIDPDSRGMVKGLYILAQDLEHFLSSKESLGSGGGRSIGFDNLRRRFPNSLFVDLARSGWIGSRHIGSKRIQQYMEEALAGGRSVVLASVRTGVKRGVQKSPDEDLPASKSEPLDDLPF